MHVYLAMYLPVCLSICLSGCMPVFLCVYMSLYFSVYVFPPCMPACLSVSVCMSAVYLHVSLSISVSLYPFTPLFSDTLSFFGRNQFGQNKRLFPFSFSPGLFSFSGSASGPRQGETIFSADQTSVVNSQALLEGDCRSLIPNANKLLLVPFLVISRSGSDIKVWRPLLTTRSRAR